MPSPRLCRLPLFTPCASLTSVQPKPLSEGAYPGPWVLPLRLPSSAVVLSWARAVGPLGGRLWLGVCGGSAGRPSAPGRGDPGQTAPQSVLEWKPPSLFLIPPSHPFPCWAGSSRGSWARTPEKATRAAASALGTDLSRASRPERAREVPPRSSTCGKTRAVPPAAAKRPLPRPPAWLRSARPPTRSRPSARVTSPRPRPSRASARPPPPRASSARPPPLPLPSCPPFIPQVSLRSLQRTWRAEEVRGILRAGAGPQVRSRPRRGGPDGPTLPGSPAPASPSSQPDLHPALAPAPSPPLSPPPGPARSSSAGPWARGALEANAG